LRVEKSGEVLMPLARFERLLQWPWRLLHDWWSTCSSYTIDKRGVNGQFTYFAFIYELCPSPKPVNRQNAKAQVQQHLNPETRFRNQYVS